MTREAADVSARTVQGARQWPICSTIVAARCCDVDVPKIVAAECDAGDLAHWQPNAINEAAMCVDADHASTAPERHPEAPFLVKRHPVGNTIGLREFRDHATTAEDAVVSSVRVRADDTRSGVGMVEGRCW